MGKQMETTTVGLTREDFTEEEIREAQEALDFYPSRSAFWDSFTAQDHLEVIRACGLKSQFSDLERRQNLASWQEEQNRLEGGAA
jgi:hypothetical protein